MLISKYPVLRDATGNGYVSIINAIECAVAARVSSLSVSILHLQFQSGSGWNL